MQIPSFTLDKDIADHWDERMAAIGDVVRSGRFILGPNVTSFEQEAAEYLGAAHGVGVASGTDALVLGLEAMGVGPGDEVITTTFTMFATSEAIDQVGATTVLVDIDPSTFQIDPQLVEEAITPNTRAIIPVHLFGRGADMAAISEIAERHGLGVLEDCAQSFGLEIGGRMAGAIGNASAHSFFPTKNLGGMGDGGLIVTDDEDIAQRARMLRAHGGKDKYQPVMIGHNSRLDEIQAAILRTKLPRVDGWLKNRRDIGARYNETLAALPGVTVPAPFENEDHTYNQYTIRIADGRRDEVKQQLADAGVSSMVYYPIPLHQTEVYRDRGWSFPHAEKAAGEVLSLPIWPQMSEEQQTRVIEVLTSLLS